MATDYFAHAVYGVEPNDADQRRLTELLAAVKAERSAADREAEEDDEDDEVDDEGDDEYTAIAVMQADPLVVGLRIKYRAPTDAVLHLVDDEDQHPGESATPPGAWLIGYALFALPGKCDVAARFAGAEWHTWVTAG